MLNIGIDGYEANVDQKVGIGHYAYQLLKTIYQIDHVNRYTVFLPFAPSSDLPCFRPGWTYRFGTKAPLWTLMQLPWLIRQEKLDLFFSPTHYSPWLVNLPAIISIMDLSYFSYPQMFTTKDLWKLRYMGRYSIKRAKKILTISQFSKNEIIKNYNYPAQNIVVTYPGVPKSEIRNPKSETNNTLRKFNIGNKYILFVGTLQPRKNLIKLIKAFELIEDRIQLVLVGKKGWMYEPIFQAIKDSPKKDDIFWLNYVDSEDLSALYQSAVCFILPSLYEGFGIPVVEAMSNGCPVVVSRTSSLPEIAGDAGIFINPESIEDIAKGMKKALQLSQVDRKKLINQGLKQAKRFNWEECAKKTIACFEKI